MTPSDLRYQASREWMEAEILAGRPVEHRRQSLAVDLDAIAPSLAERVEAVLDGLLIEPKSRRVWVLDSGIDPTRRFGSSEDTLTAMDDPIVEAIGELPELPEPTDDVEAAVAAWEVWLGKYCAAALGVIDELNTSPPAVGKGPFDRDVRWHGMRVSLGSGLETDIRPSDGPAAMRASRAAWAWLWAAQERFGTESVAAAEEATTPSREQAQGWIDELNAEELGERFLALRKRLYIAAKAHYRARQAQALSFEDEMRRWAIEQGSNRLRLGIQDGYRMNARYLSERIAKEAPGFYAMAANDAKDNWARKTGSPSEPALLLRRRVEAAMKRHAPENFDGLPTVEILTVVEPPPQIYLAQETMTQFGAVQVTEYPAKAGWKWFTDEEGEVYGYGAEPFEAVVVRNWLGRFHLIGGVTDENGVGPAGIWATPVVHHFSEDGTVEAQDPDSETFTAAKRKPPRPGEQDDIPF